MSEPKDQKLANQNIPGMNRHERFVEVQHAEHLGATLKRIFAYFAHERGMVIFMLSVVIFGTLCSVYAPSLQSRAIDKIAGVRAGNLPGIVILMLCVYLLHSMSQLLQGRRQCATQPASCKTYAGGALCQAC